MVSAEAVFTLSCFGMRMHRLNLAGRLWQSNLSRTTHALVPGSCELLGARAADSNSAGTSEDCAGKPFGTLRCQYMPI